MRKIILFLFLVVLSTSALAIGSIILEDNSNRLDGVCENAELLRTGMNTCLNQDNGRQYLYTCVDCESMILWKH